jgi:hypothetical protein
MRPWRCAATIPELNEVTTWPVTSASMYSASSRAASREYSGSSPISSAAVWMESWSSSSVVAPSYRPLMVLVATRSGSISDRSSARRATAATMRVTSTGSRSPLRLRTRISGRTDVADSWSRVTGSLPREHDERSGPGGRQEPRARLTGWPDPDGRARSRPALAAVGPPRAARAVRWQVFGLVGAHRWPVDLLAVASQAVRPVLMTAVVPTYRCGAVPDSHRVPSCAARPGGTGEPAARWSICGVFSGTVYPHVVGVSAVGGSRCRPAPTGGVSSARWGWATVWSGAERGRGPGR